MSSTTSNAIPAPPCHWRHGTGMVWAPLSEAREAIWRSSVVSFQWAARAKSATQCTHGRICLTLFSSLISAAGVLLLSPGAAAADAATAAADNGFVGPSVQSVPTIPAVGFGKPKSSVHVFSGSSSHLLVAQLRVAAASMSVWWTHVWSSKLAL